MRQLRKKSEHFLFPLQAHLMLMKLNKKADRVKTDKTLANHQHKSIINDFSIIIIFWILDNLKRCKFI